MKVTMSFDVEIEIDLPIEIIKGIHNAYLNNDDDILISAQEAITATPEWQAIDKASKGNFEVIGIYNPDCYNKDSEILNDILWEE